MASGHVNRIYRPNTWLHRPMLQNVKKALANSEPSTHGTKRTWPEVCHESVMRTKADIVGRQDVWSGTARQAPFVGPAINPLRTNRSTGDRSRSHGAVT